MRKLSLLIALLAFGTGLAVHTQAAGLNARQDPPAPKTDAKPAPSLTGKWNLSIETPNGTMANTLDLKVDGKKVTGTMTSQMGVAELVGEFADGKLTFNMSVDTPNGSLQVAWSGVVKDDGTLAGTASVESMGQMAWTASRVKDKDK